MKVRNSILLAAGLFLFAGCESVPKTSDKPVRFGMTRWDLRHTYGEPLRIVPVSTGGEDWYYQFVIWNSHETHATGTTNNFGETTTAATVGVEFSRDTDTFPIHVSYEGQVIGPLPKGKVVKN